MKHVIIGTAGHVDHGKTALIQALTGQDTDRLPEEKARGLTIEPGFAHLDFSDGLRAGIVDVPGHEKFIRHMLCGAAGMDLVLLVVAADEGFMPQTAEHLDILTLLGLRAGLVALTKTDLVNDAQCSAVTADLKTRLRGTFLEGCPILPVSSKTGQGLPALRCQLHQLVLSAPEPDLRPPFRLPMDRVFSAEGFGPVVTGTLLEGVLRRGQTAALFPAGRSVRVRGLQVHGQDTDQAQAGERVAVNLAGVSPEDLRRGDVLAPAGSLTPSTLLDVRLRLLPGAHRQVKTGSQVHLHHGASVQLARVNLLDRDRLDPGQSAPAQLRLSQPLAARAGDRFVIRFLSPVETIGGGTVLDPAPARHKRGDPAALETLSLLESGSLAQRLCLGVTAAGWSLPKLDRLTPPEEAALVSLLHQGQVLEPLPGRYLSAQVLDQLHARCRQILARYHAGHPLHAGIRPAELRQKLLPGADGPAASALLDLLIREGTLRRAGDRYALAEFQIHFTRRQRSIRDTMLALCLGSAPKTPTPAQLCQKFPLSAQADCRQVLESLLTSGELIHLGPEQLCHAQDFHRFRQTALDWLAHHETLTLAQFRDLLGTSRDFALLVLETLDRQGLTQRDGSVRRLAAPPDTAGSTCTWE